MIFQTVMKDVDVTDVQPITGEYDLHTVKQQFVSSILSNPGYKLAAAFARKECTFQQRATVSWGWF